MKITFGGHFKHCREDFDLRRKHVAEVVLKPDDRAIVRFKGREVVELFTRRIDGKSPRVYLVNAIPIDGGYQVRSVFPVPAHQVPDGSDPWQVLRIICEAFGCDISIGTQTKRLFISEVVRHTTSVRDPMQLISGSLPPDSMRATGGNYMWIGDDGMSVDLALVYQIDHTRLRRALGFIGKHEL